MADTYSAPFIVNDDPHLAIELNADGVHIGQEDIDPAEARRILGPGAIIGLDALRARRSRRPRAPRRLHQRRPDLGDAHEGGAARDGLELISTAAEIATVPWFAIGGIDTENVGEVTAAGAERICVVRAIRDADDPRAAAQALYEAVDPAARGA